MRATVYQPELLFEGGRLVAGRSLCVLADGTVSASAPADAERVRLPGRALLPGLVNAHSHAFQRVLRGRTEYVTPGHETDDFWSWRELMYAAASSLDPEELFAVSRQAFLEMVLGGITAVGEFHYLHHQPDGWPYADPSELALRVISAAREVGLRICLLRVGYARAGFNVPPNPRQARFIDPDVGTFLKAAESLRSQVRRDPLVSVGLAPHSVRAVPKAWLEELARLPRQVVHMHVAEQPAEVAACLSEHGRRPVELLGELGLLDRSFTAVHAIHLQPAEVSALGRSGATACACPSTERNLGDGIIPADALLRAGASLALGSDSQATIDLLEEARQLEGHLRLLRGRRAVLDPGGGHSEGLAARLFHFASAGGTASLGLPGGELRPGDPADFFTVDLGHPSVAGAEEHSPLAAILFGAEKGAVRDVVVQGTPVVRDGRHPRQDEITQAFVAVLKRWVRA